MAEISGYCWHCNAALSVADYGREAVCTQCGRHTHVCRNCRFYQPGLSSDCQEPIADRVTDKTRANFCDYFEPNPTPPTSSDPSADDLLAAAEALFRSDD
jgi:hypothetical protein